MLSPRLATGPCTCWPARPIPTPPPAASCAGAVSATPFPSAPARSNAAKTRGLAGGRPPKFDAELYKQRNTVERGFGRFKQWRGIATRYDKYARTYAGGVLLAATIILARP